VIVTRQRREHRVFELLLQMVPGLEDRLMSGSEGDLVLIAELVRDFSEHESNSNFHLLKLQKGVSGARSDDTKGLKGPILDWITPQGQCLDPPLSRNVKVNRGFNHERTGSLLCPAGMDWTDAEYVVLLHSFIDSLTSPMLTLASIKSKLRAGDLTVPGDHWPVFLYTGALYNAADPWKGLLRSQILISVRCSLPSTAHLSHLTASQAYKHVFTSPSSVESEVKATRSGNARIHGMTRVTPSSIAYIATQVRYCLSTPVQVSVMRTLFQARFALTSSSVFSRTDTTTDSERFYGSVLQLFDDPEEKAEVDDLLVWWNRYAFAMFFDLALTILHSQIFPNYSSAQKPAAKNSAFAKIKERRAALKAAQAGMGGTSGDACVSNRSR
jgi:hypothetical protein